MPAPVACFSAEPEPVRSHGKDVLSLTCSTSFTSATNYDDGMIFQVFVTSRYLAGHMPRRITRSLLVRKGI